MTDEERKYAIEVFENANKCFEQKKKFNCDCNCDKCSASKAYYPKELKKAVDTALEALKQEPREHGEWTDEVIEKQGNKLIECMTTEACKIAKGNIDKARKILAGKISEEEEKQLIFGADMRKVKTNGEANN